MSGVANSVISAPMGRLIDKYGVKRVMVLGLSLAAIVALIYGCSFNWLMLIPAMILAPISFRMIFPIADIIFVDTNRPEGRGQAMGLSRTIWAIPSILAPMTAAIIVTTFGGINPQGIRPLYLIQIFVITSIILFIALTLKNPRAQSVTQKHEPRMKNASLIQDFKELFRGEMWLREWAIAISVWQIAMSISAPFVPLWMVEVKGADPYILGAMSTLGMVAAAILQFPMGKMADKIGRRKVYFLSLIHI